MRGVEGYKFKDGILRPDQINKLDAYIQDSVDSADAGMQWVIDKATAKRLNISAGTYLMTTTGRLVIWGCGGKDDPKQEFGALWGSDVKRLMETAWYSISDEQQKDNWYPYKVALNTLYVIKNNGNVHIADLQVGRHVKTPQGNGKVRIIDEAICVELDEGDKDILHEFDISEVELLGGK